MENKNLNEKKVLELIASKWWFLTIFVLVGIMIPPIVTRGFEFSKIWEIAFYILDNALIKDYTFLYPIFKVLPIVLIFALTVVGIRIGQIFSFYVAVTYLLFAFLQVIAVTDKHGFGILTGNFILMLTVAVFWFWEAVVDKNDFDSYKKPLAQYWVIPLAFLAFWYPIDLQTMKPDFSLVHFFTNPAGLFFCTMTPVYLALLILYYPKVNLATLRVTSLLGTIIGCGSMVASFIIDPAVRWWDGVLHLPLVFISIYALFLSFKKKKYTHLYANK